MFKNITLRTKNNAKQPPCSSWFFYFQRREQKLFYIIFRNHEMFDKCFQRIFFRKRKNEERENEE